TRIEVGAPVNVHIIAFNYSDVAGMGINVGGIPAKAIHTNFLIANQPMQLSGSQNFDLPRGIVDYTALETDTSIQMMPFSHEVSIREAGFVEFIYDLGARIDQLHVNWEVHSHMMGVNKTIFNHSTGEWEHIRHTEYTDDVADYVRDGTLRLRVDVQMSNWITPPAISVKGGR
ncbi:MAG: hypothetical protein FWD96_04670, partial [Defluviitaleaceae bacterium]|nr:hypothetical protein [Defluviitaleaceae bacterium]